MSDVEKFWNTRANEYDKKSMVKYADAYRDTIELSKKYLKKEDVVFDFACGTGITTIPLAGLVNHIDAIDISPKMIDLVKTKASEKGINNVSFYVGEIFDNIIKEEHYDVVTAFNILYFFEDIDKVLKRIYSMLKPGGVFLSATDCFGHSSDIQDATNDMKNKAGILPYYNKLKMDDLINRIEHAGFNIELEKNLFDNPPNLYVVAKK